MSDLMPDELISDELRIVKLETGYLVKTTEGGEVSYHAIEDTEDAEVAENIAGYLYYILPNDFAKKYTIKIEKNPTYID